MRALRIFVVLAEELHFGRAAKRLGLSQSTVSEQLRNLENELGVVLFERHSRGVSLSDIGRTLLEPAERLLDDQTHFVHLARAAARDGATMTLGTLAGALPLITDLTAAAAAAGISLTIRTVTWPEGLRAVANGELSALLSVVIDAIPIPTLTSTPLATSQIVVVMAQSHRLARSERVGRRDLIGRRVLVPVGFLGAAERQLGSSPNGPEFEEIPSIPHATGDILGGGSVALSLAWFHRWWQGYGLIERELDPPIVASIGLTHRSSLSGEAAERMERLGRLIAPLIGGRG